jgi:hypothetical protein
MATVRAERSSCRIGSVALCAVFFVRHCSSPGLSACGRENCFFKLRNIIFKSFKHCASLQFDAVAFCQKLGSFGLSKSTEQYGDVIKWDQSNRSFVLTHGEHGIDWKYYKHPLPENVYDVYIKSWEEVDFARFKTDIDCVK